MPIERTLRLPVGNSYLLVQAQGEGDSLMIETYIAAQAATDYAAYKPAQRTRIYLTPVQATELNEFIDHEMGM